MLLGVLSQDDGNFIFHGNAFLCEAGREYYLITAKHVVETALSKSGIDFTNASEDKLIAELKSKKNCLFKRSDIANAVDVSLPLLGTNE